MELFLSNEVGDLENNPLKCLQQVLQPGTNNLQDAQLKDLQYKQKLKEQALRLSLIHI